MSDVKFSPFVPNGTVNVPPSKSDVHRAIICAAMANGVSRISPVALSNDIKATIGCIKALGADAVLENNVLTVDGTNMYKNKTALLDCGESGSTLRFFIPIAAVGNINATFVGKGKLPQRPIGIFTEALPKAGTVCKTEGGLPLEIKGQLKSGIFEIPGNVSSQFITGLLLALPILEGDSEIVLTSPLESVGYIAMTIRTMKQFGVNIQATEKGWHIKGGQSYKTCDYTTDGDWSQAAFFMVLGAVSGKVTVKGVAKDSTQGDKKCAEILARFGAKVTQLDNEVTVEKGELKAITIDASQIPDLVPVLSVCAAFAEGTTKIINAERLRIKECDRLAAVTSELNKLGAKIIEKEDGLLVTGVEKLKGNVEVWSHKDHRIAMTLAIASTRCEEPIVIKDYECIAKSYPRFFDDFRTLGGDIHEWNVGK